MSFWMRIRNFASPWVVGTVTRNSLFGYAEQVIREEVNPGFTTLERCAEAAYYFINADTVIDFPRPLAPKFVYIGDLNQTFEFSNLGGLGISNAKPLQTVKIQMN